MQTLYGSYSQRQTIPNAKVPNVPETILFGSQFKVGDPLIVRPFWSVTYTDGSVRKAVMLTYAVPYEPDWKPVTAGDEPFSCHACTPLIGVHVFTWSGSSWVNGATQVAVLRGGAFGRPPSPVRLVKVGPERRAIAIYEDYVMGGVTTLSRNFVPFTQTSISQPLFLLVKEDNAGSCDRHRHSDEPSCYSYARRTVFVPRPNNDYYDIRTVLHGTDYDRTETNNRSHAVAGSELFRFQGNTYVSVERHGSLTNTDEYLRKIY